MTNQVIKLTKGSYTVEIAATKVEEDIQDQNMIKIARPISVASQDSTVPKTIVRDLKRIIHTINLSGYVLPQVITAIHESTVQTAVTAKNTLITKILYPKGGIQLQWRNGCDKDYDSSGSASYFLVWLEKIKFTDSSKRLDDIGNAVDLVGQQGIPVMYEIELNLFRGSM
jgi:hypothetical protein